MSVTTTIIESPLQLSNNFILSIETNDLTGYNIGDNVSPLIDKSPANNNFIKAGGSNYMTYNIDTEGYKSCKLSIGPTQAYRTSIPNVQPNEITICSLIDTQNVKPGTIGIFLFGASSDQLFFNYNSTNGAITGIFVALILLLASKDMLCQ